MEASPNTLLGSDTVLTKETYKVNDHREEVTVKHQPTVDTANLLGHVGFAGRLIKSGIGISINIVRFYNVSNIQKCGSHDYTLIMHRFCESMASLTPRNLSSRQQPRRRIQR